MTAQVHDTNEIDRFMREVEDTEVFRVEWKELLPSGPRSISKIGACFLAASAEQRNLSLVGSPESTTGLVYTTLIACVLQVSKKGIEAFRLTLPRMSSIYQMSGRIFRILEDIITCIRGLPDARGPQVRQAKLAILSRLTDESASDAQNVGTEFLAWVAAIDELRRAIHYKQYGSPQSSALAPPPPPPLPPPPAPASPVPPSSSVPRIPSLPSPTATDLADMRQPISDLQFWRDVPGIEACTRRTYKSLTSSYNTPNMSMLKSYEGERYIIALSEQLEQYCEAVQKLVPHSPPYMAKTLDVVQRCLVQIRAIKNDPLDSWAAIAPFPQHTSILRGWGLLQELARAAEYHLNLSAPVDTWDRADLMDAQYYPDYKPPILLPFPTVAIPVRQAPRYNSDSLTRCMTALDEAYSEAETLGRFFSALSATGEDIVTVEVQNFKICANRLVAGGDAGPSSDQEHADLINAAQSIKAYFAVTRAVAVMYNHVHQMYFEQGLELLHDLNLASTNTMRASRHRALDTYCQRVTTELETYAEGKKIRIVEELRSTMAELFDIGR